MSLLRTIREPLAERVGRAELRLFDAILAAAPSDTDPGEGSAASLDKAQVLAALARAEGKAVSDEVIRSRLKKLRAAFAEIGRTDHGITDGFLALSARKDRLVLTWAPGTAALLERAETKRVVAQAAHAARVLPDSDLVDSRVALPTYQVFISHGWQTDSPEIEAALDDFVGRLRARFKTLPSRYQDRFAVSVWFDRNRMGAGARYSDQAERACARSQFAILLINDKWSTSENCRREFALFESRDLQDGISPYRCIQLSGEPADQDQPSSSFPRLPQPWNPKHETLLSLWTRGDAVDKDNFVTRLRNEICAYLEGLEGLGFDPEPTGSPAPAGAAEPRRLREVYRDGLLARDLAEQEAVETRLQAGADKADELAETGESIEALGLLETWARDRAAEHRILAILGGFGMGKTVAVQRLADRLFKAKDGPTPVYLDFRRLIPSAKPGEPIRIDLAGIIHGAIGEEARRQISPDRLVEMIRSEPCVVIFDGLDEVGNRIGRDHAAALYRQLLELVPREAWQADAKRNGRPDWAASPIRIIVTCRTHFFRSLAEEQGTFALADRDARSLRASIRTLHMAPLSLDAIETLFTKSLGEEGGARAFATIQAVHDLPGLARRPLMARYIGEIAGELVARHQSGEVINIATVYEELFDRALARDNDKVPLLSAADRVDILKALARHLHREGIPELDVAALERWFDAFALDHAGLQLAMRSGDIGGRVLLQTELRNASFLVRVRDDRFVFAHTSFYEYFLGLALLDAVLAGAVDAFDAERLSRETMDFMLAAARQKGAEGKVKTALDTLIAADAPRDVRALVWQLMRRGANDAVPALPRGANLSGLDLRDLRLPPGTLWDHVRLDAAILTGLDARQTHFRNVYFDGTWIGDTRFDNCRFIRCKGKPNGASSARVWRGDCDGASARLFEDTRFHWPIRDPAAALPMRIDWDSGLMECAALAGDSATVLTGDTRGLVQMWDAATGVEIRRFSGHESRVNGVAFSPDGVTLLTGSDDGTARLWDADSGAEIRRLAGRAPRVVCVAFSPNGATVMTGGSDGIAQLWNAETGLEVGYLTGHRGPVLSAAIAPNNATILTSGRDGTVRLWDTKTAKEIKRLKGHWGEVASAAFAPNGETVLTGGSDGIARLSEVESGAEILRVNEYGGWLTSVAFSPDGETLLTSNGNRTVRLLDANSGAEILRLEGHREGMTGVAVSADGLTLLTSSHDGTARLWDARSGAEFRRLGGRMIGVSNVAFSPDGAMLLTSGSDGIVRLWDAESGVEVRRLVGHRGGIIRAVFSPNGATLLTSARDNTARLWDTESGVEIHSLAGDVYFVAFVRDGATAITLSSRGLARLWDAVSGVETHRWVMEEGRWATSLAIAPDGVTLLVGYFDGTALILDVPSGAEIHRLRLRKSPLRSIAFCADGATIVTGDGRGTTRLWDLESGVEIRRFRRHGLGIRRVAVSPDGATLLTSGSDGTARLWDKESGEEIGRIASAGCRVSDVAFSPDGAVLLTGSDDGTARLWDAATGDPILEILPLPDSWAVFDADGEILRHGPNLWRYAYCLAPSASGRPQVVAPDEAALTRLEVSSESRGHNT